MGDLVGDVLAQQTAQFGVADAAVGYAGGQPTGQLVVPEQDMPPDQLAVLLCERHESVSGCPVVVAAGRFDSLPFHDVLGCHGGELGRR